MPLSGITQYVYDQAGHLLAESDDSGNTLTEYVWLDDMPIALVANVATSPTLYFVHTDHLDRPIRMTDSGENVVWDAVYNPFGGVNSITGAATNNLRFPGQYFLMEDGLHYNWYRHYDPTIGRYIQPDPLRDVMMTSSATAIGLVRTSALPPTTIVPPASGLEEDTKSTAVNIGSEIPEFKSSPSLYTYVNANPLSKIDPKGLFPNATPVPGSSSTQACPVNPANPAPPPIPVLMTTCNAAYEACLRITGGDSGACYKSHHFCIQGYPTIYPGGIGVAAGPWGRF